MGGPTTRVRLRSVVVRPGDGSGGAYFQEWRKLQVEGIRRTLVAAGISTAFMRRDKAMTALQKKEMAILAFQINHGLVTSTQRMVRRHAPPRDFPTLLKLRYSADQFIVPARFCDPIRLFGKHLKREEIHPRDPDEEEDMDARTRQIADDLETYCYKTRDGRLFDTPTRELHLLAAAQVKVECAAFLEMLGISVKPRNKRPHDARKVAKRIEKENAAHALLEADGRLVELESESDLVRIYHWDSPWALPTKRTREALLKSGATEPLSGRKEIGFLFQLFRLADLAIATNRYVMII